MTEVIDGANEASFKMLFLAIKFTSGGKCLKYIFAWNSVLPIVSSFLMSYALPKGTPGGRDSQSATMEERL